LISEICVEHTAAAVIKRRTIIEPIVIKERYKGWSKRRANLHISVMKPLLRFFAHHQKRAQFSRVQFSHAHTLKSTTFFTK